MLIGTRTLRFEDGADRIDIAIEVHAPERGEDGGWFCRYAIDWPDERRESEGWGHDALQAVWLTLSKIGIEIYTSAYHQTGRLVWEEAGQGYGFPVPPNARDMLVGDDALFL
jgi:hypothetical protein